MTAVIWCCVFNLSWASACRPYWFSGGLLRFYSIDAYKGFY